MPGFFDFLGDLGSGAMDVLGNVGSAISSAVTPIGNFAASLAPILSLGGQGLNLAQRFNEDGTPQPPQRGGLGQTLGNVAEAVAPVVGLASTGLGAANAIQAMQYGKEQQDYLKTLQQQNLDRAAALKPVQQAGAEQYLAGKNALLGQAPLPAAMEGQVKAWEDETRLKIRDYLARAGIGDSSMAQQYDSWIANQAAQMRATYAGELQKGGLAGFTAGTAPPQDAWFAAQAGQQGAATNDLLAAGQQALQLLAGQGNKGGPQQPGAPAGSGGASSTPYGPPSPTPTAEGESPYGPYADAYRTGELPPEWADLSWLTGQQGTMDELARRVAQGEMQEA